MYRPATTTRTSAVRCTLDEPSFSLLCSVTSSRPTRQWCRFPPSTASCLRRPALCVPPHSTHSQQKQSQRHNASRMTQHLRAWRTQRVGVKAGAELPTELGQVVQAHGVAARLVSVPRAPRQQPRASTSCTPSFCRRVQYEEPVRRCDQGLRRGYKAEGATRCETRRRTWWA